MKHVATNGNFADWTALLELLKTYYAFVLLKFIHSLVISLFLNKSNEFIDSLFIRLNIESLLFLFLDLNKDILFEPPLSHADSDNANHANADKDCQNDK